MSKFDLINLNIDLNWTFSQTVDHLKTLRDSYEELLAFFSYFDLHEEVEFKRRTRNAFYSLNLPEWQIDKIWNYMNHYEFLYILKGIANRQNVK